MRTEQDYERMEAVALVQAWMLAGTMRGDCSISAVAQEIAKSLGNAGEWDEVREIILDGLRARSDEHYEGPGSELAEIGHAKIGEDDVWWRHDGGVSEWYADRPDWWDEQVEQWSNA